MAGAHVRGAHEQHSHVVALLPLSQRGRHARVVVDVLHEPGELIDEASDEANRYCRVGTHAYASLGHGEAITTATTTLAAAARVQRRSAFDESGKGLDRRL